jgi:hypothetical protein
MTPKPRRALYALNAWDFLAGGNSNALLVTHFSSNLAGHVGELCIGLCTFAGPQQMRVDLRGEGWWFHSSFNLLESLTTPPTFEQIGGFRAARIQPQTGPVPTIFWDTGTLTQSASVPVPETLFPMLFGLMLIVGYRWRTRC